MIDSIEWLRMLILEHRSLEYGIILLGATFGGELALFIFGFLLAQNILTAPSIIFFSLIGAFLPNLLWYLLGGTDYMERIVSHRNANGTFSVITEAVRRISRGSHLLALILIKFLVGTPVLLILYTNKTNLSFRRFFYYQSIATILSILVIMPMGYVSGRGFSYFSKIFENLYAGIGFLILVLFLVAVFQVWLERVLAHTEDEKM